MIRRDPRPHHAATTIRRLLSSALLLIAAACGGPEYDLDELELEGESATEQAVIAAERREAESFQREIAAVVASHYQSCAPALRPGLRPAATMRQFYGQPESHTRPSQCRDRRNDSLDYVSFLSGSIEPDAGRMSLSGGEVDAFQRYNCSGFVAATMAAGGRKYYRSQNGRGLTPRTFEITQLFKRADSCFVKPRLSKESSLLPGDIINLSHGHVVRVLTVGPDPLAFGQLRSASDCKKLKPENMDFTFAHATSDEDGNAQSGVRVEHARDASTSLISKLGVLARRLCKERFKNGKLSGTLKDEKFGTTTVGIWPFDQEVDMVFSLRRHVGSQVRDCNLQPVEVRGSECLKESCYQSLRESSAWE